MNPKKEKSDQVIAYPSPLHLLLLTALSVFISETSIMILLYFLPPLSFVVESLVDSILLVGLLSPTLYLFLFRPMATQITQRSRAEDALRNSEERYRLLVEFSPYGITITSEGKIIFANSETAKILGASSPEMLIGKPIFGKIAPLVEEKILRMDGTPVDVEVVSIPVTFMGKNHMYSAFHDITERKKTEALLRENERLVLANETKSEFLTIMRHELRTPLNSILGFSDLLRLRRAGELNTKQEDYLNKVISSGKHLMELIDDILDFTEIDARKIEMIQEEISVTVVVDESLDLIRTNAQLRKVTLKKEIDQSPGLIYADRKMFKKIFFYLLSNAVKFTKDDGGTVTVTAKGINDAVLFSVSDTGIGIKEEDIDKLFRVFQQIDMGISRKYGGTGLGLAITKQLVERHGGRIWVKSKYGEGTTFTFSIPLVNNKEGN